MKKFMLKLQKIMLAAVMGTGFLYALTNVNVACFAWCYQPTPPKSLQQYKKLQDD